MPETSTGERYVNTNMRLPADLLDELRAVAKAERRSTNAQLIVALERGMRADHATTRASADV